MQVVKSRQRTSKIPAERGRKKTGEEKKRKFPEKSEDAKKKKTVELSRALSFDSDSESEDDEKVMKDLCDDSSECEDSNFEDPTNPNEVCIICDEAGYGKQLWYRCTTCGKWYHALCSGWDTPNDYVCNFCN